MRHDIKFWWLQRVTSICMIPVFIYLFFCVLSGDYFSVQRTLQSGEIINNHLMAAVIDLIVNHTFAISVFMAIGMYHGALGMQVIIEDYVSEILLRNIMIAALYTASLATLLVGIFAILLLVF